MTRQIHPGESTSTVKLSPAIDLQRGARDGPGPATAAATPGTLVVH